MGVQEAGSPSLSPPSVTGSNPWPNVRHFKSSCSLSQPHLQGNLFRRDHYHSSNSLNLTTEWFCFDEYFSLCTLSIYPAFHFMLSELHKEQVGFTYIANLLWQLIHILWQDTSNRHHWLQAPSSAFLFLGCSWDSFSPPRHTDAIPSASLSWSCTNKERNTPLIALSISQGQPPPDIP